MILFTETIKFQPGKWQRRKSIKLIYKDFQHIKILKRRVFNVNFIVQNFSAYVYKLDRLPFLDFIPIDNDRLVLAAMGQAIKRDYWSLFFKPLDKNSWVTFISTTVVLVLGAQLSLFLHQFLGIHAKIAKKIATLLVFLAWMGFVMTFSYYQGVLTMFFATKADIPFETMKDVIKSYPKWKLMIESGSQAMYTPYVEAGDPHFVELFSRIEHKPDETLFANIEEVITRHHTDAVVISARQSIIDKHRKYGKSEQHNKLKIFQRNPFQPSALVVTKNSPFGPVLNYAARIMRERGVFRNLKLKWTSDAGYEPFYDGESLNLMHFSLVFASFSVLLGISFGIFLGEICSKKIYQYLCKLNEKWNYTRNSPIFQLDADKNSTKNGNQTRGVYRIRINDRMIEFQV